MVQLQGQRIEPGILPIGVNPGNWPVVGIHDERKPRHDGMIRLVQTTENGSAG